MIEARWNGMQIASSDDTVVVEGNHYFPADAVTPALLTPSATTTVCPWKGVAHYYNLHVDGADSTAGARARGARLLGDFGLLSQPPARC